MKFESALLEGRLVKRYKRFLADVILKDGSAVTAHCPNTGSMKNCWSEGDRVWLRFVDDPKRKLKYTWELVELQGKNLACINTGRANHLVKEAILEKRIPELIGYSELKTEVKYGDENSRIDILLKDESKPSCFVEIKNVTLLEDDGIGYFPDAKTTRGTKHLRELMAELEKGNRAVLFFNVAHTGIKEVRPASHIDPEYAATFTQAVKAGVEVFVYGCEITENSIAINYKLNIGA